MADETPESEASTNQPSAFRITWDINIATVFVLLSFLGTAMYFIATARTGAEQAVRDEARLEGEIGKTQGLITTVAADLRAQIATLPDQRARLEELERREGDHDRWRATVDTRLGDQRDLLSQERSELDAMRRDVESMRRASEVNLDGPGARKR
jgi:hypothetical protein